MNLFHSHILPRAFWIFQYEDDYDVETAFLRARMETSEELQRDVTDFVLSPIEDFNRSVLKLEFELFILDKGIDYELSIGTEIL